MTCATLGSPTYAEDLDILKRLATRYGTNGLCRTLAEIGLRQRPFCPSWVTEPATDDEIIDLLRMANTREVKWQASGTPRHG